MVILSEGEIARIISVIDAILSSNSNVSVAEIKKKYGLTSEEYNMIFELAMPFLRKACPGNAWRGKYQALRHRLWELTKTDDPHLRRKIRDMIGTRAPEPPSIEDMEAVLNE